MSVRRITEAELMPVLRASVDRARASQRRGKSMGTCDHIGCTGHLGKFDDCIAETLYDIDLISGAEAQHGDADGFGAYVTLHVFPESETLPHPDSDRSVVIPAGAYILTTVSTGGVSMAYFDNVDKARAEYAASEAAYGEWLGDDETPHKGHYSRLGGAWWCDTCNSPYCERA